MYGWTVVGVILFAGGFVVFLLPFTLASTAPHGWQTGYIITMIIVGLVLLIIFGLYEVYLAPTPFLNYKFLIDRTIMGACFLDMTYQISYYRYATYLTSFLQVVYGTDVATAGYISNTFSVVSFVFLFIAEWLIRVTGQFKWILWVCVPLYILGLGLMIHFRQPGGYIKYIVMCEVFFSVAGSVFHSLCATGRPGGRGPSTCCRSSVAVVRHGQYGRRCWQRHLGCHMDEYVSAEKSLPESSMDNLYLIYESLPEQLSYPVGSPTRDAIVQAYGYAQTRMLAACTAFMVLGFVWVGIMRNLNVKTMTQTKGNVF